MDQVNPKVTAATGGAGVGGALAIVLIYVLERIPAVGDLPAAVEAATVVLVSAALAFVAGYLKRDGSREEV